MRNLFAFAFTIGLFFAAVSPALASGVPSCAPVYGGGTTCAQTGSVEINKTIKDPKQNSYKDNLDQSVYFTPNQAVTFQITIKNIGKNALQRIAVKDAFPQFVAYSSGPGNYDKASNSLTINVDKLAANESKTFTITGKVVNDNALPKNQKKVCVVNQAFATVETRTNQDNSKFCIERSKPLVTPTAMPVVAKTQPKKEVKTAATTKGGLPVHQPSQTKKTPDTGAEAFALFGLVPAGALGLYLRRRTISA